VQHYVLYLFVATGVACSAASTVRK
jgi:hypothetical protein